MNDIKNYIMFIKNTRGIRLFHVVNEDENAFNWRLGTKRKWNEGELDILSMFSNTLSKFSARYEI